MNHHSNINYLVRCLIILNLSGLMHGYSRDNIDIIDDAAVDAKIERKLFGFIEDLPVAGFRDVTVEDVENMLAKIARLKEIGGGTTTINDRKYHLFRYAVVTDRKEGTYWVEFLAIAPEWDPKRSKVVNARIVYVSNSGIAFYNNLIPPQWPVATRRAE
jgi:hypothetical protein